MDRVRSDRGWSLADRLFVLLTALLITGAGGVLLAGYVQLSDTGITETAQEMLGIAHTLAATPDVRDALDDPDPSIALQPLAERVRRDTATDFVVVMSPAGVRYSHTDPAEIGRTFRGSTGPAAAGVDDFTETYTGTLGPSVRAVVPVRAGGRADGDVVALVSVGRSVDAVSAELAGRLPLLIGAGVGVVAAATAAAFAIARWLRRTTHARRPDELARMSQYYDAVLHAVREGLLLLDADGHVVLINDEARRLLGLDHDRPATRPAGPAGSAAPAGHRASDHAVEPTDPATAAPPRRGRRSTDTVLGRRIDSLGLPAALGATLAAGALRTDELHLTAERIVVLNQAPARHGGRRLGTVVTLRDHTELRALTNELDTIRGFARSLGAQAHEAANHLHTVISLIELGRPDDALTYASAELELARHLTDAVLAQVGVPELAALLVGKAAEASERGVELRLAPTAQVPAGAADPRDLVTIVGNLVDNAVDAALDAAEPRWVEIDARRAADGLELRVRDSGPGLPAAAVTDAFTSGWSTKPTSGAGRGLGLALVARAAHRRGGRVELVDGPGPGAEFRVLLP